MLSRDYEVTVGAAGGEYIGSGPGFSPASGAFCARRRLETRSIYGD